MNKLELLYSPRKKISEELSLPKGEPEMSEFESAYLCGLIKKVRPKKILEVGVAAGATTSIILECLDEIGIADKCELISVDLNQKFYRNESDETGYVADLFKEKYGSKVRHTKYFGNILPEVIEKIGDGIDFIILDTVHSLPGELLDLPVIIPFVSQNATLVLHDVTLQFYGSCKEACATQVVLDVCSGNKDIPFYLNEFASETMEMPNIGSVVLDKTKALHDSSVFYSMLIPWRYAPPVEQLESYRKLYTRFYSMEMVQIFDKAVSLNLHRLKLDKICLDHNSLMREKDFRLKFNHIYKDIISKKSKYIYLYCANDLSAYIYRQLYIEGLKVDGWFDQNFFIYDCIQLCKITEFSDEKIEDNSAIIVCSDKYFDDIRKNIEAKIANKKITIYHFCN